MAIFNRKKKDKTSADLVHKVRNVSQASQASTVGAYEQTRAATPPLIVDSIIANASMTSSASSNPHSPTMASKHSSETSAARPSTTTTSADTITNPGRAPSNGTVSQFPWSKHFINYASPFPRYGHAANCVAARDGEIFVMGGLKGSNVYGDLWVIESDSMTGYALESENPPSPRVGHAALTLGNAFIMFGGDTKIEDTDELDDNLYLLNTATLKWTVATPKGPRPNGRYGHSISTIGSKVYIFGGQLDDYFFDDLVCYDLTKLRDPNSSWEIIVPSTRAPPPRTNHSMVTFQDKLYLFGGTDGKMWYCDTWVYDPAEKSWSELDCSGFLPDPCEGHAATIIGDIMYLFGGRSARGEDSNALSALRLTTRKWFTFQNLGPGPSPRAGHSMSACGSNILIMGGESIENGDDYDSSEQTPVYILDTSRITYPIEKPGQLPKSSRTSSANGQHSGHNYQQNQYQAPHQQRAVTPQSMATGGSPVPRNSVTPQMKQPVLFEGPFTPDSTKGGSFGNEDRVSALANNGVNGAAVAAAGAAANLASKIKNEIPFASRGHQLEESLKHSRNKSREQSIITSYEDEEVKSAMTESTTGSLAQNEAEVRNFDAVQVSPERPKIATQNSVISATSTLPSDSSERSPSKSDFHAMPGAWQSKNGSSTAVSAKGLDDNEHETELERAENGIEESSATSAEEITDKLPKSNAVHLENSPEPGLTKLMTEKPQREFTSDADTTPRSSFMPHAPKPIHEIGNVEQAIERLKASNSWYEVELAAAKEKGYVPSSEPPVDIRKMRIVSQSFTNDDGNSLSERDILVDALANMRDELQQLHEQVERQAQAASLRLSHVEKQRDEFKTRLDVLELNGGLSKEPNEVLQPDMNSTRALASTPVSVSYEEFREIEKKARDQTDRLIVLEHQKNKLQAELEKLTARNKEIEKIGGDNIEALAAAMAASTSHEKGAAELRKQLDEHGTARSELEAENRELREKVASLESQLEDAFKQAENHKALAEHHENAAKSANLAMSSGINELVSLWNTRKEHWSSDRSLSANDDDSESNVSKMIANLREEHEAELGNHKKESKTALEEMKAKHVALLEEKEQLSKELENTKAQLNDHGGKINQHEEKVRELSAKHDDVQRGLQDELEKLKKSHERALDEMKNDHSSKYKDLETNQAEKQKQLEADHASKYKELEDLHAAKYKKLEDSYAEYKKEFENNYAARYKELELEFEKSYEHVKNQEEALNKTRDEVSKYKELNAKLQAKLDDLKLQEKDDTADISTTSLGSSGDYTSSPKINQMNLAFQLRDLRSQVIVLKEENNGLQERSMQLRKAQVNYQEDAEEMKQEIERLKLDKKELSEKLALMK